MTYKAATKMKLIKILLVLFIAVISFALAWPKKEADSSQSSERSSKKPVHALIRRHDGKDKRGWKIKDSRNDQSKTVSIENS